jgi:hypothetical protein
MRSEIENRIANEPESANLPRDDPLAWIAPERGQLAQIRRAASINTRGGDAVFDAALEDTFSPR